MKIREFFQLPVHMVKRPDLLFRLNHELLFILGHMRGYTTLLGHILGSNPDIGGHNETHIKYQQIFPRFRLQYHVANQGGGFGDRYLLDKCLHNGIRFPEAFVLRNKCRFMFTVRRPVESLQSIHELMSRQGRPDPLKEAKIYYCDRLTCLSRLADQFPGSSYFLGEQLIESTEILLARMTEMLELGAPLMSDYKVFSDTGKLGAGDFSGNIVKGRVLQREEREREGSAVDIPSEFIEEAEDAYARCLAAYEEFLVPLIVREPIGPRISGSNSGNP